MSDRLQELLQQRALLQSHLAWLDREIAAASGQKTLPLSAPADATGRTSSDTSVPPPALTSPPPAPINAPTGTDAEAEQILAHYRLDTTSVRTDVRKGCLLYFFGAFLLLGLVLTAFYFFYTYRQHSDVSSDVTQSVEPAQR